MIYGNMKNERGWKNSMYEQMKKKLDYHDRIFKEIWEEGKDFFEGKDHFCMSSEYHFTMEVDELNLITEIRV